MDYLILLDRKFPYRTGESFLESEIDEVAGQFDRVLVYPSDPIQGEEPTRDIDSPNVEVRLTNTAERTQRAIQVVRALRYLPSSSEKGARRLLDAYCLAEASDLEERVAADFERECPEEGDTIYIYSYWLYTTAIAACNLKRRFSQRGLRCVAVSRAHRFDIYEEKRPYGFLPQRERLLGELDHVYACSEDGARYLRERYREHADNVSVSYLGTYDHGLSAAGKSDYFRVVSCSRVTKIKRLDLIAEAMRRIDDAGVSIEWVHLGGGEGLSDISNLVKDFSSVRVDLRGAVPNTAVYEHYATHGADLFVNVSESEGLPVSIMEAISFGIPVVATAVGGTPEIVVDGVSGSLLDSNPTPADIAFHICKYAKMAQQHPQQYESLRTSARMLWGAKYQAKKNYALFAKSVKRLGQTLVSR